MDSPCSSNPRPSVVVSSSPNVETGQSLASSAGWYGASAPPRVIHRHHRKLRAQGGDESEHNIMLVSPEQHRWIHDHPRASYELGWLVKSWQDPAEIPITGTWPLLKEAS